MLVTLMQLSTFYDMENFLIDLDTSEVFMLVKSKWRCAGLYCMNHLFELEKLWKSIEHNSAIMKCDLEQETQTSVVRVRQTALESTQPRRLTAQLPSLLLM